MNKYKNIVIIGSGSWGTALATVLCDNKNTVYLYDRNADVVDEINATHINKKCFPSITLSSDIIATNNLECCRNAEIIILAVPAQVYRQVIINLKPYLDDAVILICSKGIEVNSLKLLSEVCKEVIPNTIAILSGPNFASEIIEKKPSAAVIACNVQNIAFKIANTFNNKYFRSYFTDDIIGVQVAGAAKNVIAIAAGIIYGMNLGENAAAAMLTRGMSEVNRLNIKLGGRLETMLGLAGIGDLTLTCNSQNSRNMNFGIMISRGSNVKEILKEGTFEGYYSAIAIYKLAKKENISLSIFTSVYKILYENADITYEYNILMNRPSTCEYVC